MALLLADAIEVVVSLVVLAIGFIGWISQIIGASKQAAEKRGPGRPAAGGGGQGGGGRPANAGSDPLRNEIEAFLKEVQSKAGGEPSPRPAPPRREPRPAAAEVADEEIEFLDEPPARRAEPEPTRGGRLEERHLESTLADRHLPEMKPKRRRTDSAAIEREVDRRVAEQKRQLLEANRATERRLADAEAQLSDLRDRAAAGTRARAGSIRAMLADPTSVRDAIVVAEILERPKRGI